MGRGSLSWGTMGWHLPLTFVSPLTIVSGCA